MKEMKELSPLLEEIAGVARWFLTFKLLSNQKSQLWVNFRLENIYTFHVRLEYFTDIWDIF
jgi:hypothetical protein